MYKKLYGNTMVSFLFMGREVRLDRENCLQAIENIKAERDSFATQERFDAHLNVYIDAAKFMGWID